MRFSPLTTSGSDSTEKALASDMINSFWIAFSINLKRENPPFLLLISSRHRTYSIDTHILGKEKYRLQIVAHSVHESYVKHFLLRFGRRSPWSSRIFMLSPIQTVATLMDFCKNEYFYLWFVHAFVCRTSCIVRFSTI